MFSDNTATKNNPDRICMVVHEHFPRDFRVRREARALLKAGIKVTIVSLREPGQSFREHWMGLEVIRLPIKRHRGSPLPVYLAEYMMFASLASMVVAGLHPFSRFKVIHIHTPPDFLSVSGLFAKLAGVRVVLDIHDLTPELYASRFRFFGGRLAKELCEKVELGSCLIADRVITTTEAFKDRLVMRGTPKEKILVVSNYPDPEIFGLKPKPKARKKKNEFVIVHHGTMLRRYGQDILLEAFEKVLQRVPEAKLEFYGRGDLLPELKEKARKSCFTNRVRFHGEVAQEEIVNALLKADLCVVPNRTDPIMELAFPTKLLEAIHMGCPVVASATQLVADTFDAGSVKLVEPGNLEMLSEAIIELAQDPEARKKLARKGKKAANDFSWEKEQQKLVRLYRELGCSFDPNSPGGSQY